MPDQLQLRGGTTTEHNSFTGVAREVTVDTTKKTLVVHDGASAGGTALMKESGSNAASSVGIGTGGSNAIEISNGQDIKFLGADGTKNFFFDKSAGNIGVGTITPAERMHLSTSGGATTTIRMDTNTNACRLKAKVVGGENHLVLSSNNDADSVVITGNSVGIGTTSPSSAKLQIHGTGVNSQLLRLVNTEHSEGLNSAQLKFGVTNSLGERNCRIEAVEHSGISNGIALDFFTNNTNSTDGETRRMRIGANGNVGIGTVGARDKLEIKGSNAGYSFRVNAEAQIVKLLSSDNTGATQGGFRFCTDNGATELERCRIDTDGDFLVGLTSALSTQTGSIQAAGPIIAKSYINAHTSNAAVLQYISNKVILRAYGATANSGIIQFNTGGGGDQSDSSAMTIDAAGNCGIGTDSPISTSKLDISGGLTFTGLTSGFVANSTPFIYRSGSDQGSYPFDTFGHLILQSRGDGSNRDIIFVTGSYNNNPHMTVIKNNGRVGIGIADPDHKLHCEAASAVAKFNHTATGDTTGIVMRHARGGLSGFTGKMISFIGNDSTEEGSIVIHTTTTAYNTSSDYRLKENEVAISDGITRLKQLKPYIFNFKKDPDVKVDGFFAHEVSSVVPIAVTGEKDAVNDDGSIKPQGIDQSKLVPLLVAAVQELIGKVEALEAA